jgi:hypothetical protein
MEGQNNSRTDVASSAASWPAIIAGAFVAAGASLILLALGSGFGLASVSGWGTFAIKTAIWLIVMQWVSAGLGGYIAGRLRTRWIGTHIHEVFFRDTAHGLVTWAVATVAVAAIIGGSLSSMTGGRGHTDNSSSSPFASYGVDKLFRSAHAADAPGVNDPRLEAAHIMASAVATGGITDADKTYLAEVVSAKAGVSQADAQKRVDDWIAGAESARKAAATASIYTALSLLIGAFIASVAAVLGGRLRDEHP